jgi:hypothetical protein
MVKLLKTKKGYFYKILKNGIKKRITKEEYKKNKTRKTIKMIGGGGGPIEESDIMYQDKLVCILKPEVKKGIIIWTHYAQPPNVESLCTLGLKTGQQLQKEGVDFGRNVQHPYIFFRAPYYSRKIDYSTPETEIISSFGEGTAIERSSKVFIRVDPDRTFVFSSEIRSISLDTAKTEYFINNSKKTLSKYLEIINKNLSIEQNVEEGQQIYYNLYSSKASLFPSSRSPKILFDPHPINENSEILVSIPHLTPDYFVLCNSSSESSFLQLSKLTKKERRDAINKSLKEIQEARDKRVEILNSLKKVLTEEEQNAKEAQKAQKAQEEQKKHDERVALVNRLKKVLTEEQKAKEEKLE